LLHSQKQGFAREARRFHRFMLVDVYARVVLAKRSPSSRQQQGDQPVSGQTSSGGKIIEWDSGLIDRKPQQGDNA
jgi:hypothetical protein